jgi:hypothetical protein
VLLAKFQPKMCCRVAAFGKLPEKAERLQWLGDMHALTGVACLEIGSLEPRPRAGRCTKLRPKGKQQALHLMVLSVPVKRTLCGIPVLCLHPGPALSRGLGGTGHHCGDWLLLKGHRGSALIRLMLDLLNSKILVMVNKIPFTNFVLY